MGGSRQGWAGSAVRVWLAALAVACLLPCFAHAQAPGISNIRFRHYGVAQGLPQASVVTIAQDREGFIWIGTQGGLVRFDGYDFQVFQHHRGDADSLANDYVRALAADPRGGLWIGTQVGGLDYYDAATGRFTHYHNQPGNAASLAGDSVSALAMGAHDRLWIATSGGRLQWIDRGQATLHTAALGERAALAVVGALLPMPDGSVLVGTRRGLWRVNAQGTQMQPWGDPAAGQLDVAALVAGPRHAIWVGTGNAGLYEFAPDGKLLQHFAHVDDDPTSLPNNAVPALAFDRAGRLWVSCNTAGVVLLDPRSGRFRQFVHSASDPQSVAANRVSSLFVDGDGLILAGTWSNGLSIHDPRSEMFTQIVAVAGNPHALPADSASSILTDADGTLWIGLLQNGGLVHFDLASGVLKRYVHDPHDPASLTNNSVLQAIRAPAGTLWVMPLEAGLDQLRADGKGFVHLRHNPDAPGSLGSDSLRDVYVDHDGTLWAATEDAGLDERCATCSAFIHHRPGHGPDVVNDIGGLDIADVLQTRDGAIWVATFNAGLYRRAKGATRFQNIRATPANGLVSNAIATLFQDRRGNLWVGTQGGGLDLLPDANPHHPFKVIDSHDGLASNAIGAILEDAGGSIWVSTLKGISRIDPATLRVQNFSAHDGASELGYWIGSGAALAGGRLAFGGPRGITIVDPAALKPEPPARPVITALVLGGQRFANGADLPRGASWRGDTVRLTYRQDDFGAEFASLEYASPQTTQYAYRLDGYDQNWIDTTASRRVAYYTNLSPGTYHLRVRARHAGGPWSTSVASLTFEILPAPWAAPRAIAAYVATVLAVLLLFGWRVRLNLRRRRAARIALVRSGERLKLALWGSGSEMWDVDLRTGEVHHENHLQNLAAEVEGTEQTLAAYNSFLHPDDAAGFATALREHLAGRTESFEASYRTRDLEQNWIWLLTRGRVVERDADGRAVRISGTSSEITELKQAEASLRRLNETLESRVQQRTHQLQDANAELRTLLERLTQAQHQLVESEKLASLGSLVAGVAHEINTPLGIGVTAASYLHDEATRLAGALAAGTASQEALSAACARISEGADLILRNLRRADQLVKSFKQVAVDQTGGDVREIDLGNCIADVVATLQPSLRRGHHTVSIECPDALTLRSSPGALGQIITNLAINSVTHGFAPDRPGHITITARRAGNGVVLDYRDDGVGMTPEVRARTFEPFFTTRRGQGGTGLGMHIVYTLVTRVLHGTVELESAPGAGIHVRIAFASLDTTPPATAAIA